MIPPQGNAEFVAAMERVLDICRRPYDAAFERKATGYIFSTRLPSALRKRKRSR